LTTVEPTFSCVRCEYVPVYVPTSAVQRFGDATLHLHQLLDHFFFTIAHLLKTGDEAVAKAGAYVRDGDHITPVREQPPASN